MSGLGSGELTARSLLAAYVNVNIQTRESSPAGLEQRGRCCCYRKGKFLLGSHDRLGVKGSFHFRTQNYRPAATSVWFLCFSVRGEHLEAAALSSCLCFKHLHIINYSSYYYLDFCIYTKYKYDSIQLVFFNLPSRSISEVLKFYLSK